MNTAIVIVLIIICFILLNTFGVKFVGKLRREKYFKEVLSRLKYKIPDGYTLYASSAVNMLISLRKEKPFLTVLAMNFRPVRISDKDVQGLSDKDFHATAREICLHLGFNYDKMHTVQNLGFEKWKIKEYNDKSNEDYFRLYIAKMEGHWVFPVLATRKDNKETGIKDMEELVNSIEIK
jgi:hypothetical protein